jgi:hypothetical protein
MLHGVVQQIFAAVAELPSLLRVSALNVAFVGHLL